MKIKIVSGGYGYNTHVVNADTGEKLEMVKRVTIDVPTQDRVTATVEFFNVELEMLAETEGQ